MKFALLSASVFPALACGSSLLGKSDTYGLPWYGLKTNGVALGWVPSDGNASEGVISPRYTLAEINQKLGAVSSTYGMYSHLNSDTYNGYELLEEYGDVIKSGAVFIPSVMPVLDSGFPGITPEVASQVATVMREFTDKGVIVWLRFGHEMNWYTNPAAEPRYYGTPAEFVIAWANVAKAVADNPLVKMFWSPNNLGGNPASDLDEWYPGDDIVDLVGIDCYPQFTNQTFEWCYQDFYDRFSAGKQKPFAIGETGADAELKENWLKQLVNQNNADYPNYISMSWFEYLKQGVDFRVVVGNQTVLEQTKETLGLSH
ncbi:glycoside hydrolase family 26 protein [Hyaloscypha variabilis]